MDVLKFTSIQASNADAVCALIAGCVRANDEFYDPIREMEKLANQVRW